MFLLWHDNARCIAIRDLMIQSHIASMGNFQGTEDNKLVSGIFLYYVLHLSVVWVCQIVMFPIRY